MGTIAIPNKVKFFCGVIYHQNFDLALLKETVEACWGSIDECFDILPFHYTDYYDYEMGTPLWRTFWSFRDLMEREELVQKKIEANKFEEKFLHNGKRRVNIDPGYLTLGQLILASTKDREQRIYLGRGIYAEVTLRYSQKHYHTYPWTYRDYASEEYEKIFLQMRRRLYQQQKTSK